MDLKEIKKTLTKPSFYSNLLFILTIFYLIFKIIFSLIQRTAPTTSVIESIIVCLIIIIGLAFQMYSTYKSGIHRNWYKEKVEEDIKQIENPEQIIN